MRVLVCGDRNWNKPAVINTILDGFYFMGESEPLPFIIIEGCARGADRVACEYGEGDSNVIHEHYPAEWDKHGRSAGPIRNRQMLVEGQPDVVFAFHDNISESKGTRNMAEIATKAGIPVYVIGRFNGC